MEQVTYRKIKNELAGQRLDNYLISTLKGVPKSKIYKIIRSGEVRANRKRVPPSYRLQPEDEIRLPPLRVSNESTSLNIINPIEFPILFEDEHLLVIDKPAGFAVHAGSGIRFGVIEHMRACCNRYSYLELAHRLDRETSGCLILAKSRQCLKKLQEAFLEKKIKKTYTLVVVGRWPKRLNRVATALDIAARREGERFVQPSEGGKESETTFSVRLTTDKASLLEASPKTGRTHQIRVHAQFSGHPIIGDGKYGHREQNDIFKDLGFKRLYLHASRIKFQHPISDETLLLESALPLEFEQLIQFMDA